jgi:hypothetical protein
MPDEDQGNNSDNSRNPGMDDLTHAELARLASSSRTRVITILGGNERPLDSDPGRAGLSGEGLSLADGFGRVSTETGGT